MSDELWFLPSNYSNGTNILCAKNFINELAFRMFPQLNKNGEKLAETEWDRQSEKQTDRQRQNGACG